MMHKRGRYSAEFKEKVALAALTGAKTHAQIASEYGISPDLVKDWKKQAREMLGECFHRGGRKSEMEKKRMSALRTWSDFWESASLSWIGCQKKQRSWVCSATSPTPGQRRERSFAQTAV